MAASNGTVYVAEAYNARVSPYDIVLDAVGDVYVADANNHRIQKFTPDGGFVLTWGEPGTGPGQFNQPGGLTVDPALQVFVADGGNDRVQKFAQPGPPPAPLPAPAAPAAPVEAIVRFTG